MAKVAHGLADDLLTTLALARDRTRTALLIAPAMNVEMWENPATQRNAAQLRADGTVLLGPAAGNQARSGPSNTLARSSGSCQP
jgi:phosphopantothenoylcysteine decarboxylase/phosphopantothenate--cysteine ligase